ncbi:Putative Lon protease [endosymbiont DhMRE of Dentiscutata heterogama]|uniref:AAA family ATPase n=1 Tax=endosymbiont DhMRE of Dentiscutata heterogama TaxID=1609546 RepID=UPI000629DC0B|nr:AAA family ATPase [endosymbiont DhMRE of Dentiscutata heterogama]CFW92981.1 Putative Lon protease [endosymbiont DhMRE of Dentiscutata heterogama]
MARIIDKFPTFTSFFNDYSANFLTDDEKKDKIVKTAHLVIARSVYYRYRERDYLGEENDFFGDIFSRINTDSVSFARSQKIFTNIIEPLKIKDKVLFVTEVKTEHSKSNEKTTETPQTTEQTNIPLVKGENLSSGTYGRAQILKQKKQELKTFERNTIKGRKVLNDDGTVTYKDTYDIETRKGEKNWLGRLINALQHIKFDVTEIVDSYWNLFNIYVSPPMGEFITLPSGKRKWIVLEDDEEEDFLPTSKKKKTTDTDDITWKEWVAICGKKGVTPTEENYYLECITRYRARKEKERAPAGSLTALAIDKQKELADGIIKGWETPKAIPDLDKFDNVMDKVIGFTEFKRKFKKYIVNLEDDVKKGKKTEQTIYVLLGPPGIGKSYICEILSEATGWYLINVDLGGRTDTGILEGVSPATKSAFAGRLCEGLAVAKQKTAIILLDEFEKVRDEGLENMLGNVLDIKKNKDFRDQFLSYRIDLSHCIIICTANYAKQVKDFVQDRATFVNIELYTYEQRENYVINTLKRKLAGDENTARYANQINKDFCKYIITEAWGLRQVNANIEEIVKSLKFYVLEEKRGKEKSIEDFTKPSKIETTPTRFNMVYKNGQEINLNRIRTASKVEDEITKKEKIVTVWTELTWPDHKFSVEPKLSWTL